MAWLSGAEKTTNTRTARMRSRDTDVSKRLSHGASDLESNAKEKKVNKDGKVD